MITSHAPRSGKSPARTVTRYLARELLRVFVDEDQLVRDALYRQRVRGVRAHMAKADHTKNSFFAHIQHILSS